MDDLAGEGVAAAAGVRRGDRAAAVAPDVEPLDDGEAEGGGALQARGGDDLAVDDELEVTTAAESAAVVGEAHADLVGAGGERLGGAGVDGLDAEVVVGVDQPALDEEERPAAELAALGDQDAVGAGGGDDLRLDRVGGVLQVGRRALVHVDRGGVEPEHARRLVLAVELGQQPLQEAVVEGQHVVLLGLDQEERLQLGEPLGVQVRHVACLGPVGGGVVELPDVVVEVGELDLPDGPRRAVLGHRRPALVVDPAVAVHLEVLRGVALRRVGLVEAVAERRALDRVLRDAVDRGGVGQSGCLEHGGGDVDDVVPLVAQLAPGGDAGGPVHDQAVARAAVVGGDLLGPLVGRVHRQRPADVVVRVGGRAADVVELLEDAGGAVGQPVEAQRLVEGALEAALAGGAVVAEHVEHEGVVELTERAQLLHEPADLGVGVLGEGGVDLHQPLGHDPVVVGDLVPVR